MMLLVLLSTVPHVPLDSWSGSWRDRILRGHHPMDVRILDEGWYWSNVFNVYSSEFRSLLQWQGPIHEVLVAITSVLLKRDVAAVVKRGAWIVWFHLVVFQALVVEQRRRLVVGVSLWHVALRMLLLVHEAVNKVEALIFWNHSVTVTVVFSKEIVKLVPCCLRSSLVLQNFVKKL